MTHPARQIGAGSGRSGGAVLTTLLLVVALAIVLLVLLKVRADRRELATILAGPLIPVPTADITGLMLTSQNGQFRLDKYGDQGWTLSGGSMDYVDSGSMEILLKVLSGAQGGAVLPGTEPEDRRYEFNGPLALRLTVFAGDKRRLTLAMGTINPVTGRFYASGMGRVGCFMVDAGIRKRLAELPRTVELKTLLPPITARDLKTISLWRGGSDHLLERRGGRWWLQVPARGISVLGPVVAAYQELYHDRFEHDQRGDWVLASTDAVGMQVYELDKVVVREIKPAAETAAWFSKWGLDDPWRKVVFSGPGINPDPTASSPDRMELALGEPLGIPGVPVARRGVVLLADGQAAKYLDKPLGELVHRTALTFPAVAAVKMQIFREGKLVLAGERNPGPLTDDGRTQWRTTLPTAVSEALPAKRQRLVAGETLIDMDRMDLIKPLPPVGGSSPLQDQELVEVRLTYAAPDSAREDVFQVGYLKPDVLPAEAARTGSIHPAGLWWPSTGQLLQVPDGLVVSARNFENLESHSLGGADTQR